MNEIKDVRPHVLPSFHDIVLKYHLAVHVFLASAHTNIHGAYAASTDAEMQRTDADDPYRLHDKTCVKGNSQTYFDLVWMH